MNIIPRIYQIAATNAAVKALRDRLKRALVVLATGLGKTLTSAFIAKKMRAKRVLFLVHNNFILQHAIEEFAQVFDEKTKMAIYNGLSRNGAQEADIVFATWQTMGKNLKYWARNHFDLIIVDEAQHTEADTFRPTVDYFTGAKLGITATPDREDEADIRDVFGPEVINVTLEEAIARGWLPRIEYHVITDESLDVDALQKVAAEIRNSKRRFTMAEVNRRIFIKKRDDEIARIINGYGEKALVFCSSIPHAERMTKSLVLSASFHSKKGNDQKDSWDKNQKVLDELKNGVVRRVCAVNAFNEGVNVPSIGLVAFCRVTGVITIFRQQLGRGLRPGKDKLIVLDFVGNLERIQHVLEMMNMISDLHEQFTPKEEIEREGYVRQRFEVSGKGFEFTFSDKVVDLMEVLEHCGREFYPTWQEASKAAIALGIRNKHEYENQMFYKKDSRLPSSPQQVYADFPGWIVFLGNQPKNFYPTWQEASGAAIALGIKTQVEYRKRYKEDPRLPASPEQVYADFSVWKVFLGGQLKEPYGTCQEASRAAIALGIKGNKEYNKRYKEDPRLPSAPSVFYADFPGWMVFLDTGFYKTWQEATRAIIALGIKSQREYAKRYKEDSHLPSNPHRFYADFQGWNEFLGKV